MAVDEASQAERAPRVRLPLGRLGGSGAVVWERAGFLAALGADPGRVLLRGSEAPEQARDDPIRPDLDARPILGRAVGVEELNDHLVTLASAFELREALAAVEEAVGAMQEIATLHLSG